MPGVTVDGNDPLAVQAAVAGAADRARAGDGPTLIEAMTYRLYGHVFGDRMAYVAPDELDAAWRDEPVARFRRHLVDNGALSNDSADAVDDECARLVSDLLAEVLALPEPGSDELLTDVVGSPGD
jgi:TPP-dependent pyruvate/acetoin dehydrogenase alpha subunit